MTYGDMDALTEEMNACWRCHGRANAGWRGLCDGCEERMQNIEVDGREEIEAGEQVER